MANQIDAHDGRIAVGDGVRLRVLSWDPAAPAAGRPFLLVHGLASNARLWDGVARHLAEAGRRSAAVDLRGHGRSDKPEDGYDFGTMAEDLRGLVAALGFDRPILVGQSWGAGVVLDFAVRHPDVASGIVLVDGGLNDLRDGFASWEACWQRLAPPQLIGRPLSDVEGYFNANHRDWPREGIEASLANFEIRPDGTIAPWLTRERHKAILKAMWDQRVGDLWTRLRVSALIIPVDGGDGEWTAAKRAGAAAAESAAASSGASVRVRWFHGDHDIHAQHPIELGDAILEAERGGLFDHGSGGRVRVPGATA
jgi:pimeloyl-ACP methyl ester carboxylesterase